MENENKDTQEAEVKEQDIIQRPVISKVINPPLVQKDLTPEKKKYYTKLIIIGLICIIIAALAGIFL